MTDTLIDGTFSGDLFDSWLPAPLNQPVLRALTADGIPVKPPRDWFMDPGLKGPTPLTVEGDGKVFGHIATWNTSHIGLPGGVKPPRSRSNYGFFATGALETDGGDMVDVGQITLVGGHAPIDYDTPRAVQHYDESRSAVCDVAIGEDRHGIWVSGALRPDVDDLKVRTLRASSVSGDWRPINGNLELVAVCSVNVPGFPIPRARVASGQVLALVAAGVEPLNKIRLQQLSGAALAEAIDAVSDRLSMVETTVIDLASQPAPDYVLDENTIVAEQVDPTEKANRLRSRVYAPLTAALDAEIDATINPGAAALRARVHGDGE